MASTAVLRQRKAPRIADEQWESWKSFIRTKFLIEDEDMNTLLAELRDLGFAPTKSQLESRLKVWDFRKNLTHVVWRCIDNIIHDRLKAQKKSVVILSGRRLPKEKVDFETSRNRRIQWNPNPIPPSPLGDLPLYICTPRGSSVKLTGEVKWPNSLPWLQFSKNHLTPILESIEFKPAELDSPAQGSIEDSDAASTMSSQLTRRPRMTLSRFAGATPLPLAFEHIVRHSLRITTGSEELALHLFARQSIDCIAGHFDAIIPETYPDESLQRAAILTRGCPLDLQRELLKIILYVTSNQLFRAKQYDLLDLEFPRAVVDLCRLSGLTTVPLMSKLVELSKRNSTLTAVINALFYIAVNTESIDLISCLLFTDDRINVNGEIVELYLKRLGTRLCYATPLLAAVIAGRIDLTAMLLDAGADLGCRGHLCGLSLLALAIFEGPAVSLDELIRLLLRRNAPINESQDTPHVLSALHAAIIVGDTGLVDLLVAAGADITYRSRSFFQLVYEPSPFKAFHHLDDVGCLGLAASFSTTPFRLMDWENVDNNTQLLADQEKALAIFKHVSGKYGSHAISPQLLTDAMILAAARGYTKILSLLYHEKSAQLDCSNGDLSPIYAAVLWNQTESCRLLLELGASLRRFRFGEGKSVPNLLHVAVARGSCRIVRLLVSHGAQVEETCDVSLSRFGEFLWLQTRCKHLSKFNTVRISPFQLAISQDHLDVACVLAAAGASVTSGDLVTAAKSGHLQLVKQLIAMGISPDSTGKDGASAYRAALSNDHVMVAKYLIEANATISAGDFTSIFRMGSISCVKRILPHHVLRHIANLGPDYEHRSWLENAVLTGTKDFIKFAFSLDPTAYDSGALCASVLVAIRVGSKNDPVLIELLRRRDQSSPDGINPVLENTAVSLASRHQRFDIVDQLLLSQLPACSQHFARIPAASHKPYLDAEFALDPTHLFVKTLSDKANNWHKSPYMEVSPLLFAIQASNLEILEVLMRTGYKADGYTLKAAIRQGMSLNLVKNIIQRCEDINAEPTTNTVYFNYTTPLMLAATFRRIDIVEALLDRGADPNAVRTNYDALDRTETALGIAAATGNLSLVQLLLDRGAMVDNPAGSIQRLFASTPLQIAARHGYVGIVQCLLSHGADINARPHIWPRVYTSLVEAASRGRIDTIQFLLDSGVDTEGCGRAQYIRAIRKAAAHGYSAAVDLLEKHRPWTVDDQVMSGQLQIHDDLENMKGFPYTNAPLLPQYYHPLEFIELITELSVFDKRPPSICRWFWGPWRLSCFEEVVIQIQTWPSHIATLKSSDKYETKEEAARIAIEAIETYIATNMSPDFVEKANSDLKAEPGRIAFRALSEWAASLGVPSINSTSHARSDSFPASATDVEVVDEADIMTDMFTTLDDDLDQTVPSGDTVGLVPTSDVENKNTINLDDDGNASNWEEARQRAFRKDLAGEAEAPFIEMEWEF